MSLPKQAVSVLALLLLLSATTVCAQDRSTSAQVEALNQQGLAAWRADRYEEALASYEQALAIYRRYDSEANAATTLSNIGLVYKAQGRYNDALTRYEQALAIHRRLGRKANVATTLNNIGSVYEAQGRYGEALFHLEQALTTHRRLGREASVAITLNNIGSVYKAQGRYDEALARYEQALTIHRRLGREASVATTLNNIGSVYEARSRYDEALARYDQALAIDRRLGRKDNVATTLNNIGSVYEARGRYDEALASYEQVLGILRRLDNEPKVATVLTNIGVVYNAQGRYDEALVSYEQALAIDRRLGREAHVATILTNIGAIYDAQGSYDEAIASHEQALAIDRRLGREAGVATTLTAIGVIYQAQGRYDEALSSFDQALAIDRRLGREAGIANYLNNVGAVYQAQGRYDEALSYFERVLAIDRRLGNEPGVATVLSNIGRAYRAQGRYDEALSYFERVLAIDRRLGNEPGVAGELNNIGRVYRAQGRYDEAASFFERAVALKEHLRQRFRGDAKRDYLASQIGTYRYLLSTRIRLGEPERAFAAAEQSAARLLAEKLAVRDSVAFTVPPATTVQQALDDAAALLVYANAGADTGLGVFVITRDRLVGVEVPDSTFKQDTFAAYRNRIIGLDGRMMSRRQQQRAAAGLDAEAAQGLGYTEGIVQLYRRLLVEARQPTRGVDTDAAREDLGRRFHDLLIAPIAEHLEGKTELIVVPSGPLGFLPFETLMDSEGRYLAERFHVRYAPSATVWHTLQQQGTGDAGRKPLLAFGGADYTGASGDDGSPSSRSVRYANAAQIEAAQRRAYANLTRGRSLKGSGLGGTYDALGYGVWTDLPGTRAEVEGLASTVPGAEIVTGPAVSEAEIKRRSNAGELAQYRLLHFATHGLVVPEVPELSALVLSQGAEANTTAGEDGYLRMAEIAQLNLGADVVTLSACETGLGQLVGGEGVVGLTQAFIEAGAGGVSASLWQVSDRSTSVFMQEVYRKVQDEGLSFAAAHTAVKRGFIQGDYLNAWRAPYYWAPYVYYGR